MKILVTGGAGFSASHIAEAYLKAGHDVTILDNQAAAKKELTKIQPLDTNGEPSKDGKIVLISLGMSNTTQEFSQFKKIADAEPNKSPSVVIVDCAQNGQGAAQWAYPDKYKRPGRNTGRYR